MNPSEYLKKRQFYICVDALEKGCEFLGEYSIETISDLQGILRP